MSYREHPKNLWEEAETEASVAEAVAFCLKYAPDRVGGGGRKKSAS